MQPAAVGQFPDHPVVVAPVVEDDILDHPDVLRVTGGDHVPVGGIAAQPGIDLIMVSHRIAVIAGLWLVVEEHRIEPDRIHAERIEVVHMLGDALQVAPVAGIHLASVDALFAQGPPRCRWTGHHWRSGRA